MHAGRGLQPGGFVWVSCFDVCRDQDDSVEGLAGSACSVCNLHKGEDVGQSQRFFQRS